MAGFTLHVMPLEANVRTHSMHRKDHGLIPGKFNNFSLLQTFETDSGAHPVSYSMLIGGFLPEG
jgi:hypothetical protein